MRAERLTHANMFNRQDFIKYSKYKYSIKLNYTTIQGCVKKLDCKFYVILIVCIYT